MNTVTSQPIPQGVPVITKESLYDQIGDCTLKIVTLKGEISALSLQVMRSHTTNVGDPWEFGLRDSLHEKRNELESLQAQVKNLRLTLKGRLELEHEAVLKKLRDPYASAVVLEDLTNYEFSLICEIDKLGKLTA